MMSICYALLGEHGVFYRQFDYIREMIDQSASVERLVAATQPVVDALISHSIIENETILPAIAAVSGPGGPAAVMRMDHEEIEALFTDLLASTSVDQFKRGFDNVVGVTKNHFMKEEEALFVMAKELLNARELEELGCRWSEQRGVTVR